MELFRELKKQILSRHTSGFINIIYGPRRVGKTTLSNQIINERQDIEWLKINGDNADERLFFTDASYSSLKRLIQDKKGLFIDEAQRIPNIGISLKILIDNEPDLFILVTGSSSIDLAKGMHEPLTGRTKKYRLFPLSINEIENSFSTVEVYNNIENFLKYGTYPHIFFLNSHAEKADYLKSIVEDYLFKDLKEVVPAESFDILYKLATLLAFQLGGEVSLRELSSSLGIDVKTVKKYLNFLKQAFIIFEINGYSRNLRKEVNKNKKYYFWDLGIRNALINQLQDMEVRSDKGGIWENFMALERKKLNEYKLLHKNFYFWRTYDGAEIDWIEEVNNNIEAFEFKYSKEAIKTPQSFLEEYKVEANLINRKNFLDYID